MRIAQAATLMLISATLHAQVIQTGSARGFVLDASGGSVPGAAVTMVNETRLVNRAVTTGSDGGYLFLSLPAGTYALTAEAPGFSRLVQKNVIVQVGDDLRLDINLRPGAVATSIEVTAQQGPAVNTVNANINNVIGTEQIRNMLLPANDAIRSAAFLPGAVDEYTHNGLSSSQDVIVVDGENDGDEFISAGTWKFHPPADAVAELRVTDNGYSAEFGRASATRIEMATKSGTDQFHGSVYWFYRNKNFNANNWGSVSKSLKKYNEVGYAVGGPIRKGKIYFFWTNYYRRNTTPISQFVTWPTQAELDGDFSAWLNPGAGIKPRIIKDPATGQPFPNNVIPSARLNNNALAYIDLFYPAVGNARALVNNDYTSSPQLDNDNYYAPRFDYQITDKLNMYARYTHDDRNQVFSWLAPQKQYHPDPLAIPGNLNSATVAGTYVASPRMLIDFQATFMRTVGDWQQKEPDSALLSRIPGWPTRLLYSGGNVLNQLPDVSLGSGYTTIGRAVGRENRWAQGTAGSSIAIERSRHSLKFGFEEVYRTNIQTGLKGTFGTFNFDGSATGDSLADMLLGKAYSFSEVSQPTYWQARALQHGTYAQDEIKVNKQLTVTLGVRWEMDGAYKAVRGQQWANWLPNLYDPAQANRVDPKTGIIAGPVNNLNGIRVVDAIGDAPRTNFAPRASIAWAPWGNRTAFRAGYGMFFDHQQGPTSRLPGNPPFRYSTTLFDVSLDDPTGGRPDANRPTSLSGVSLPFRTPRTHKYSFSGQHEFSGILAEVSYIGSRGTDQVISPDINLPYPNADVLAKRVSIDAVRPFAGFSSIAFTNWGANARYNSLQAQLKRPLKNGLLLQASYTYQKSTVDGADTLWWNRSYDAGEVANHQIFSLVSAYQPRIFEGSGGIIRAALNGWELSGDLRWLSGSPLGVMLQTDTTGTGRKFRADWIGHVTQNNMMSGWFDASAFSQSPPLAIGNSPRDAVWGPGSLFLDGGLFRDFRIAERKILQLRFEAYNALNHFNLNNPVTTFGLPTFGSITAKGGAPRNLQAGLRFTF